MNPVDIILSLTIVTVVSLLLLIGIIAITAACFGHRRAIAFVCNGIVSGQVQIVYMAILTIVAGLFMRQNLSLTAFATLYSAVVLFIVATGFWTAARRAAVHRGLTHHTLGSHL